MPIDFPNSPTTNQEHTVGSNTWVYDGAKWNIKTAVAYANDSAPVGTIVTFAGSTPPSGWLQANGASLSTSTYAQLFSVIGYTFGGSGANFNLPDVVGTTGIYIIRYSSTLGTVSTDSLYTAPVGTMMQWPTTSSYPTGWLRADGTAVSRTSYADLFSLIGTTYGTGDGGTTFNLPNMVAAPGAPVYIIKSTLSGGQQPSVISHAANHIRTGSDVMDGDRLQVDWVPANYTRDSSPAMAGANTDLTAHLKGIDTAINALRIPPMVRIARTSGQTVTNAAWVYVDTWSEIFDTNNMWTSANNYIEIQTAGVYLVQYGGAWAINGTNDRLANLTLNENTAGNSSINTANVDSIGVSDQSITGNVLYRFSVGDRLRLAVYQNSGGNLAFGTATNGYAYMSAVFMGVTS